MIPKFSTLPRTEKYPLVLYFATEEDSRELIDFVRDLDPALLPEKPSLDLTRPPVPELQGAFPAVLHFSNDRERQLFINLIKHAKPGMEERSL